MNNVSSTNRIMSSAEVQKRSSFRGFWSLFITQFQGAFSDNVYRTLVMFIVIGMTLPQLPDFSRGTRMAVVGALFALPFILFSMAGGYLADRYSKRTVTIVTKIAEIGIMLLASLGLVLQNVYLMLATVFLMGAQSAFFGPSKYGLLPELLSEKRLSWGNGLIELGTFLAIIFGTIGGGWLYEKMGDRPGWLGMILVGLAIVGTFTSLGISRLPAADPQRRFEFNFVAELVRRIQLIRRDRVLWMAVLGNTYFFFLGALIQQYNIYAYGKDLLGLSESEITTYLMASMAAGIGIGSVAAGYLSGRKIEYGLIPLGSMGMVLFGVLLAVERPGLGMASACLALYGFSAGFFIVPIAALIQHRPDRAQKGAVIGAANLLSFVGIFMAAGVYALAADAASLQPKTLFVVSSMMTLVATVYVIWLLPDSLVRLVLWLLTNTIYRIRVVGRDHIPEKGGALFVCNHVSFVDALLLLASTDRRVRFMMFKAHYELPYIRPFARILGVIPISSEQRPREMIKSLQMASEAIRAGDVVCIFAEGQITRTGQMLPFRRGLERIMKDVDAPIIPVALDGVWGSIFSFERGRILSKFPRRIPYPVTVNYGAPLAPATTPFQVRAAVQQLLAEAWSYRKDRMKPLHRSFVRTARLHPFRLAMADAQNSRVTFSAALVRTVFLARRLKSVWAGQKTVGLFLPPSVSGALVNFAAMLSGRVPVNLNYTLSEATLASCIQQCGIQTVVTSRAFLDRIKLKLPCKVVYLEQVVGVSPRSVERADNAELEGERAGTGSEADVQPPRTPRASEKIIAAMMAFLLPAVLLERLLRSRRSPGTALDDLATVIFSSGSTGDPKGVMLSHYNVGSNIEQLEQVFGLNRRDTVLGILPFFHSFGFTGTLCLPAVLGVGVIYHPNPLDAKSIGALVRDYRATFLLATPTFLQLYMRSCAPEEFGSLRVVMTGAEKLPERLTSAFEEQFGIRPLEGYGCTECSPAVAVNTYDFRSAGFRQVGGKRGKIGHPLPGVSVRIVDPDTMESAPLGQPGLLLVRGPNVMQGYLGRPEKTSEVLICLSDGAGVSGCESPTSGNWYVTGDIAALDEDGFLQITDRLSRFSKIGGEMVPHIRIEEKLHELAGVTEQTFVVAGVPDEKKGEKLIVLHKLSEAELKGCLEKLGQADLPNLWKPRPDQFCRLDTFPYLGTGKLDLRKVKEIAGSFSIERLGGGG